MNAPLHHPAQMNAPQSAPDTDPEETREWRESFDALLETCGPERARFMLSVLNEHAGRLGIRWQGTNEQTYVNTIPVQQQPAFPGDLAIEQRLAALMRWNALAMVVRANAAYGELGGHIASYASVADLFEVGFNHFFRA